VDEIESFQKEMSELESNQDMFSRRESYIAQFKEHGIDYDTPSVESKDRLHIAMASGSDVSEGIDGFDCMYKVIHSSKDVVINEDVKIVGESNVTQLPKDMQLVLTYRRAGLEPASLDLHKQTDPIQMVPNGSLPFDIIRNVGFVLNEYPDALIECVNHLNELSKDVETSLDYLAQFREAFEVRRNEMDKVRFKEPQDFNVKEIPKSVVALLAAMGSKASPIDLDQVSFEQLWSSLSSAVSNYQSLGLGSDLERIANEYYSVNPDQLVVTIADQPKSLIKVKTELDKLLPTLVTVSDVTTTLSTIASSGNLVKSYVKSVTELRGDLTTLTAGNNGVMGLFGKIVLGVIGLLVIMFIKLVHTVYKRVKEVKEQMTKGLFTDSKNGGKVSVWIKTIEQKFKNEQEIVKNVEDNIDLAMSFLPRVRKLDELNKKGELEEQQHFYVRDLNRFVNVLSPNKSSEEQTISDFKGVIAGYNPIIGLILDACDSNTNHDTGSPALNHLLPVLNSNLYNDPEETFKLFKQSHDVLRDVMEYGENLTKWMEEVSKTIPDLMEKDLTKINDQLYSQIPKLESYTGKTINIDGERLPLVGGGKLSLEEGPYKTHLGKGEIWETHYAPSFAVIPSTKELYTYQMKKLFDDVATLDNPDLVHQSRRNSIRKKYKSETLSQTIAKINDASDVEDKLWDYTADTHKFIGKMNDYQHTAKKIQEVADKELGTYMTHLKSLESSPHDDVRHRHLEHCEGVRKSIEIGFRIIINLVSGYSFQNDPISVMHDVLADVHKNYRRVINAYRDIIAMVAIYDKVISGSPEAGLNTGMALAIDYQGYDVATRQYQGLDAGLNNLNPRLRRIFILTFVLGIATALSAWLLKKSSEHDKRKHQEDMEKWRAGNRKYFDDMTKWGASISQALTNDRDRLKRINDQFKDLEGEYQNNKISKEGVKKLNDMLLRSIESSGNVDETQFTIAKAKLGFGTMTEQMQQDLVGWWAFSMFNKQDRMKTTRFEAEFLIKNLKKVNDIADAMAKFKDPKYHSVQGAKQFESEVKLFAIQSEVSRFLDDMNRLTSAKFAGEVQFNGVQEMVEGMVLRTDVSNKEDFWREIADPDFFDWEGFDYVDQASKDIDTENNALKPVVEQLDKDVAELLTVIEGIKDASVRNDLNQTVKMSQKTAKDIVSQSVHYLNVVKYYHLLAEKGTAAFKHMYNLGDKYVHSIIRDGDLSGGNNSFDLDDIDPEELLALEGQLVSGNNGVGKVIFLGAILSVIAKTVKGMISGAKAANEKHKGDKLNPEKLSNGYERSVAKIKEQLKSPNFKEFFDSAFSRSDVPEELISRFKVSADNPEGAINAIVHHRLAQVTRSAGEERAILSEMVKGRASFDKDNVGVFIFGSSHVIPIMLEALNGHLDRFRKESQGTIDPEDYLANKLVFKVKGGKPFPVKNYCDNHTHFLKEAEGPEVDFSKLTTKVILTMVKPIDFSILNGEDFRNGLNKTIDEIQAIARSTSKDEKDKAKIEAAKNLASAFISLANLVRIWNKYVAAYSDIIASVEDAEKFVAGIAGKYAERHGNQPKA